jgi:hypothetical protein
MQFNKWPWKPLKNTERQVTFNFFWSFRKLRDATCRSSGCSEWSVILGKENILASDTVVFRVMMQCGLVGDINFSEEYTAFIVRVVSLVHPEKWVIYPSKTLIPTCRLYFLREEGEKYILPKRWYRSLTLHSVFYVLIYSYVMCDGTVTVRKLIWRIYRFSLPLNTKNRFLECCMYEYSTR